jgi:integrase
MARRQERRLTALDVKNAKEPGMLPDGNGLYLRVRDSGTKHWVLRYRLNGKRHDMSLGTFPYLSLAEAREMADGHRREHLKAKLNPLDARRRDETRRAMERAKAVVTFDQARDLFLDDRKGGWKNKKHHQQWRNTLAQYASPIIGEKPISEVTNDDVLAILKPIWQSKAETASRVRGRIESVLDWAKVKGHRGGENPAAWRGNLVHILPTRNKRRTVKHHAAMPWADVPQFMSDLNGNTSISSKALQFTILTAVRTGEAIGAMRSEINVDGRLWIIPKERMKADVEFRVPLTDAVLAVLDSLPTIEGNPYLFPGARKERPISNMAMAMLLRDARPGLTVHGFRSSFRDWAGDNTGFPRDTIEMCLAHVVVSDVEAAYRRSDMIAKRRRAMEAWARYCMSAIARRESGDSGVVIDLKAIG